MIAAQTRPIVDLLARGGETGRLIACHDWSGSPLGPVEGWPTSLTSALGLILPSPAPMVLIWGETGVLLYNDAYARFVGERHPRLLGAPVREGWPEVVEFHEHVLAVTLAGGVLAYRDQWLTLHRSSGPEQVWANMDYSPVLDEAGCPAGVLAIVAETTERVRAQAALTESEAELRRVTDALPVLVSFIDREHRYRFANRAYEVWFGQAPGSVVGRHMREVLGEAAYLALAPRVEAALAGETVVFEGPVTYKDGGTRHIEASYIPRRDADGAVDGFHVLVADATARRSAEERLQESEARFRNLADHAPVMMWVTDPSGYCTYLNRAWYAFTGQTGAEAEGYGWLDATHPEDKARADEAFRTANAARAPFRVEYRLRRADGVYRWAIDAASPRFGEDGAYLGYVGSVIDIDERREAEDRQRESEARLRTLTNAVPAFVWFATPDGELHYFNDRWYEYTGQTVEEALPNGWAATLHPDDAQITSVTWADALARGVTYEIEVRYRRRDGAYRWYVARAEPVRDGDGRVVSWFGTSTDIHDRKLAESELQQAKALLEGEVEDRTRERDRIFELSNDLFAVAGFDGRLKSVNPAWSRLLGYTEAELLARPFIALIHPDDHAAAAEVVGRLQSGGVVERFEDRLVRANGEPVWIAWAAVPEGDHFYAVGRDVTQERLRDEALRQSQKMEAVGQLTGGIAHDFNNLLGAVVGSLDLIRRRPADADRVVRYADAGLQAAERGAKLTAQLLAFSRAQRIEMKPVALGELISGMSDLLSRTLGPMVRLRLELADGDARVLSDPTQLEMAVLNLAINARDAMPEGGDLTLRTRARRIRRDPELADGAYVELSVEDTGTGMAPEVAARAFDPFFTTKGVGKGTGLGLSQAYGIARQAGGTARIESRPGEGTAVRLVLPRTEAHAAGAPADGAAEPAAFQPSAAVLVIDDDPDMRRVLTDSLDALGYGVAEAVDGPSGLRVLEADAPDLLIVDFAMPGMNGAEVAKAARTRRPDLPVVFASGYADTAAIEEALGPDAVVLRKPFRIADLQAVLADALGR